MEKENYLKELLGQSHIVLSDEQIAKLVHFYEMLIEASKVMNLTTITEYTEVCRKHFLDSLSLAFLFENTKESGGAIDLSAGLLKLLNKQTERSVSLIDVGCGAGFPGMVLAIAFEDLQVTLLDSLNKRVGFLESVIEKLALANCSAVHARAEEFAKDKAHRECYDLAVSRAVANLSTLSEYCLPFVKKDGLFIAYKSAKIKEEAPAAQHAIDILGGRFEREKEFYLPAGEDATEDYRDLYVIRKVTQTPGRYPRKAGTPAREPL
ncbi:MAG: 16S rRNA (guanine(527)-N(7))-methyltransferase RsmG [Lachnospiraceae bacterium]|nr:16S rRNA (guanine(527)-N(7))-methyltransferase RsmG [Lachnospiraceae bacterium]